MVAAQGAAAAAEAHASGTGGLDEEVWSTGRPMCMACQDLMNVLYDIISEEGGGLSSLGIL